MSRGPDAGASRYPGQPTDRLLAGYLVLATPPLLLPGRPATWPLLLALHLAVVLLAWPPAGLRRALGALAARTPRASRFALHWYAILLVPILYTELAPLIQAVHGGRYFDGVIQGVEQAVFRGQPSRDLAAALPHRWLSELLHGGYLSYYFIIYTTPIVLWAAGRHRDFRRAVFSLLLVFTVHYVVFIYFPVQGPRYLFAGPGGAAAGGPLYRLAHWVLETGSSQGAAFPSSHVGVSLGQALISFRFRLRFAPVLAVLAVLVALGAVYGGFHYGVDAIGGALLGTAAVLAAPAVYRALGGDWPSSRARR